MQSEMFSMNNVAACILCLLVFSTSLNGKETDYPSEESEEIISVSVSSPSNVVTLIESTPSDFSENNELDKISTTPSYADSNFTDVPDTFLTILSGETENVVPDIAATVDPACVLTVESVNFTIHIVQQFIENINNNVADGALVGSSTDEFCNENFRVIRSMLLDLHKQWKNLHDVKEKLSTFSDEKHTLLVKMKEIKNYITNVRKTESDDLENHLSSLLMKIINLTGSLKLSIQNLQTTLNKKINEIISECTVDIFNDALEDNKYPFCMDLSELFSKNITSLRTVIQLAYAAESQKVSAIITFISKLTSLAQQVICYEALIECLIPELNKGVPEILIIHTKVTELLSNPDVNKTVSADFVSRLKLFKFLMKFPIDRVIHTWIQQIESRKFSNISQFVSTCPICLDITVDDNSENTILRRTVQGAYSKNAESITLLLDFFENFHSQVQKTEAFETLLLEMHLNDHMRNPLIYIITNSLKQIMETEEYKKEASSLLKERIQEAMAKLEISVSAYINNWVYFIQEGEYTEIVEFGKNNPAAFQDIIPLIIQKVYENKPTDAESILIFGLSCTNVTHSILVYRTLISILENNKLLNSPIAFVIDENVDKLDRKNKLSDVKTIEIKSEISNLKDLLKLPISESIKTWASAMRNIDNNALAAKQIAEFSSNFSNAFKRISQKLILSTFTNEKDTSPILNFCLTLPHNEQKLDCFNTIMNQLKKSKQIGGSVFIVDHYVHELTNILGSGQSQAVNSQMNKFRTLISKPIENMKNEWASLILKTEFSTLNDFAKQFPTSFERNIREAIPQITHNVTPILAFADQLQDMSLSVVCYVSLIDSLAGSLANETSIVIAERVDRLFAKLKRANFVSSSRTTLHKLRNGLADSIDSLLNKWAASISKKSADPSLLNFETQFAVLFESKLNTLISQAYGGNDHMIDPILKFISELKVDSHKVTSYVFLLDEMKSNNHFQSPAILVVEQNVQSFKHFHNISGNQKDRFLSYQTEFKDASNVVINKWANFIREDTHSEELINFAILRKNVFIAYTDNLIETVYNNKSENVYSIMSFTKKLTDAEPICKISEKLFQLYKHEKEIKSKIQIGYVFASFLRKIKNSWKCDNFFSNYWHVTTQTFPVQIRIVMFTDTCIRDTHEPEYLFVENDNTGCVAAIKADDKRCVYTYMKQYELFGQYKWEIDTADGNLFTIRNKENDKYLYSASEKKGSWRYVGVKTSEPKDERCLWKLKYVPEKYSTFYITTKEDEMLYTAAYDHALDTVRRNIFTYVTESESPWDFHEC